MKYSWKTGESKAVFLKSYFVSQSKNEIKFRIAARLFCRSWRGAFAGRVLLALAGRPIFLVSALVGLRATVGASA